MNILQDPNWTDRLILLSPQDKIDDIPVQIKRAIETGAILLTGVENDEGTDQQGASAHVIFSVDDIPASRKTDAMILAADPMLFPPVCLRAMARSWPKTDIGSDHPDHLRAEASHFLTRMLQRLRDPLIRNGPEFG